MEKGVNAFERAPDSERIVLTAEASDNKTMKDRKETFSDHHVFHADYPMVHLWLLDLPQTDTVGRTTGVAEPKLLMASESFSVGSFSFRPMEGALRSAGSEIRT